MIILKRFLQAFVSSFLLLATLSPAAEEPVCCLPPETDVGMYDFVPEAQLQASDFRPLMKTEHAFMSAMMQPASINLIDFTTPIPSIEIMPQAPALSGVLQPPPADSHTTYFFVGTITKKDAGFLLKVQLKKSSDSSLVHEEETSFTGPADAETAGEKNAAAMIQYLVTQAQNARDSTSTGDHAIDPHITLIIDKLRLKPKETSPVKVILTDCDNIRLKHRTIEANLSYSRGDKLVQQDNLERVTDDNGERNGDIGASAPGIITYIVKFKYKDPMGVPRETTDAKTIIVASDGNDKDLWQMRADIRTERSTLRFRKDPAGGTFSGERYLLRKKASVVFVFKAESDPSGEVSTDEVKNYNGYGEAYFRRKNIDHSEQAEIRTASAQMDHGQEAAERLQGAFSISPSNNEFQASIGNVSFKGTQEIFAVRKHPYNYVHKFDDYTEDMGGSGSTKITPQMTKSGVYTFTITDKTPIKDVEGNDALGHGETNGYELKTYTFEVRKLNGSGQGLIK